MSEYDKTKIRRLDLTVLLVFLGLIRTGKASDVADEMGLTNSSISHTLRRLRDVFEDELFLRRPHGLEPTSFAIQIEPDIRDAVDAIQSALSGPAQFDPAKADVTFRVSASDREIATFLASSFASIVRKGPDIRLSIRSLSRAESLRDLANGSLDFAFGHFMNPGYDFERYLIRKEGYLVAARQGHSIFKGPIRLKRYAAEKHILVSTDGSMSGIVDTTLKAKGLARKVSLSVPSFLPALSVLAESDFIGTLPANLVRHHAEYFGLAFCEPPLEIRPFNVSVLYHRRNRKNPFHKWCIDQMLAQSDEGERRC
ncbi:MAG: LysR family transcriptional regulator [Pseudomonadota bacterium]